MGWSRERRQLPGCLSPNLPRHLGRRVYFCGPYPTLPGAITTPFTIKTKVLYFWAYNSRALSGEAFLVEHCAIQGFCPVPLNFYNLSMSLLHGSLLQHASPAIRPYWDCSQHFSPFSPLLSGFSDKGHHGKLEDWESILKGHKRGGGGAFG